MGTITIDFETYYDREYSLRHMSPQEYIHSDLFEVIGVSVQVDGNKPMWHSGDHESTQRFLNQFLWDESTAIAHNAIFDVGILTTHFGIKPHDIFCTMMGARPFLAPFVNRGSVSLSNLAKFMGIAAKGTAVYNAVGLRRSDFSAAQLDNYKEYCIHDVEICYEIYRHLLKVFPLDELKIIDMAVRKFTEPQLQLDYSVLAETLVKIKMQKIAVLRDAGLEDRTKLMSNELFAQALRDQGVEPPMKVSERTGKEAYAFAKTDPAMKELADSPNQKVAALVAARLQHKSTGEETRTERFLEIAKIDALFGVPLLYYGAHTGRYSGMGRINLQNLGRDSELRRAITVPNNKKLVAGDLSQIEARMVATLAGQSDLVNSFADNEDVYCEFASKVYGHTVTPEMSGERFVGKQGILQLGYGAGKVKFFHSMRSFGIDIDEEEAARVVSIYRETYRHIPRLWRLATTWIKHMAHGKPGDVMRYGPLEIHVEYQGGLISAPAVVLPNGMPIYYPEIYKDANNDYFYSSRYGQKKIYGGALIENICQALARIVVIGAELTLRMYNIHTCNQIHDEIHVVAPSDKADKYKKIMELALTKEVKWMPQLPLACEVGIGNNYAEAH